MIVDPQLARARFERDVLAMAQKPDVYAASGIRIARLQFPILDVFLSWTRMGGEIGLHVEADDYDYRPPRGWWVNTAGEALHAGSGVVPNGNGFQSSAHPYGFALTWFCFPGWREYHDHQSHQQPTWASLRSIPRFRLPGVILQLHTDLNRPNTGPA